MDIKAISRANLYENAAVMAASGSRFLSRTDVASVEPSEYTDHSERQVEAVQATADANQEQRRELMAIFRPDGSRMLTVYA